MIDLYRYSQNELKSLLESMTILVDTREKKWQHIQDYFERNHIPYKSRALNTGDYSFMIPSNKQLNIERDIYFDKQIVVERKGSLEEISGNLSKERDRFEKELSLSPHEKVIIIENASYKDLIDGNYKTEYRTSSFWASLFTFYHRYNAPFIFMKDNKYTGSYIYGYFKYYLKNYLR